MMLHRKDLLGGGKVDKKPKFIDGFYWEYRSWVSGPGTMKPSETGLVSCLPVFIPAVKGHATTFRWGWNDGASYLGIKGYELALVMFNNGVFHDMYGPNNTTGIRTFTWAGNYNQLGFNVMTEFKEDCFVRDDTTKQYLYRGANAEFLEGYTEYKWWDE